MIRSLIRTNFEKFLYVLLAINLFIFFPICAVFWLHWLLTEVLVYNSEDCVLMAEETYLNQNRSTDPCDDFYEFSCGKYLKFYKDKGFYLRSRQIVEITTNSEFLFKKPNRSLPVGLRYLNDYLYSCMNEGSISAEAKRLKRFSHELNFPAATSKRSDFKSSDYNYEKLLIEIIKRGMHYEAFFQLYVDYTLDDSKPGLFFTSPKEQIVRRIKRSHLVLSHFAALMHESNILTKWAGEDDEYFDKLRTELFSTKASRKLKHDDIGKYKRVTVRFILDEFPNIITEDIINAIVPSTVKITDSTRIIMTSSERDWDVLKNANKILNKPSDNMKRAITNFIIYRTLIFADQFIHDYGARDIRCVENLFVDKRLEFSYRLMVFHNNINNKIINKVENFLNIILSQMEHTINRQSWMTKKTKEKAVAKLRKLQINYGVPNEYHDIKSLNKEPFKEFDYNHTKSYLENSFEIYRYARQNEFTEVDKPDSKLWILENIKESVTYMHLKNILIINNEILLDEILTKDIPEVFRFTFFGTFIASKICDSVGLVGKHFDDLGNFKLWWDKETQKNFQSKSNCLVHQYSKYIDPKTNSMISGEDTLQENFNDQCGLRLVLNAYDYYIRKVGKGYTIPAFQNYTAKQLFWILYAEAFCSSHSKSYVNKLEMEYFHAPDKFKVIGTVVNSIEFSKDFQCSMQTKMNPAGKCNVWV